MDTVVCYLGNTHGDFVGSEEQVMEELKIMVNDFGTLFAMYPDGRVRTILVDVHDAQHYGILRVGVDIHRVGVEGGEVYEL